MCKERGKASRCYKTATPYAGSHDGLVYAVCGHRGPILWSAHPRHVLEGVTSTVACRGNRAPLVVGSVCASSYYGSNMISLQQDRLCVRGTSGRGILVQQTPVCAASRYYYKLRLIEALFLLPGRREGRRQDPTIVRKGGVPCPVGWKSSGQPKGSAVVRYTRQDGNGIKPTNESFLPL